MKERKLVSATVCLFGIVHREGERKGGRERETGEEGESEERGREREGEGEGGRERGRGREGREGENERKERRGECWGPVYHSLTKSTRHKRGGIGSERETQEAHYT